MFILEYLVPFIAALGILVFVHEWGHYYAARRCGVRVETFSIGFGPELFGFTDRAGTRWKICPIPLGGYVKMLGDMDASSRPDAEASELPPDLRRLAFPFQPVGARAIIVAAGPLANFVFAAIVLAILFAVYGNPMPRPIVGEVLPETPAAAAGLMPDDRIVAAGERGISRAVELRAIITRSGLPLIRYAPGWDGGVPAAWSDIFVPGSFEGTPVLQVAPGWDGVVPDDLTDIFSVDHMGAEPALQIASGWDGVLPGAVAEIIAIDPTSLIPRELVLVVERGDETLSMPITPTPNTITTESGDQITHLMIGIIFAEESYSIIGAAGAGVTETFAYLGETLSSLGRIVTGSESAENLGGPLRIAQASGEVAQLGLDWILWFLAVLSINLGLINLLPIPVLDGGHLIFYAAEAIRGRPLSDRVQEYGFRIGLALVLTLMVFATWNDLVQLDIGEMIRGLIS